MALVKINKQAGKPVGKPMAPQRPVAPPAPVRSQAAPPPMRPAVAQASAELLSTLGVAVKRGPGRPSNAELAARAATNGTPAPVAPAVQARPPVDTGALLRAIEEQKATIQQLSDTIARLKAKPSNVRTFDELVQGAEGIAADDWRLPYSGVVVKIHQYGRGKDNALAIDEQLPVTPVVLALPRDSDAGNPGDGARARQYGQLALYIQREDGTYQGPEDYVYQHELAAAWAD